LGIIAVFLLSILLTLTISIGLIIAFKPKLKAVLIEIRATEIHYITHLKNTLFYTLLGLFIALLLTGRTIWRSIRQNHCPDLPEMYRNNE
jgi:uncharacterized membrane protein